MIVCRPGAGAVESAGGFSRPVRSAAGTAVGTHDAGNRDEAIAALAEHCLRLELET